MIDVEVRFCMVRKISSKGSHLPSRSLPNTERRRSWYVTFLCARRCPNFAATAVVRMHRFEYTPTAWKHLAGVTSTICTGAVQSHMYVEVYQYPENRQNVLHRMRRAPFSLGLQIWLTGLAKFSCLLKDTVIERV